MEVPHRPTLITASRIISVMFMLRLLPNPTVSTTHPFENMDF